MVKVLDKGQRDLDSIFIYEALWVTLDQFFSRSPTYLTGLVKVHVMHC